MAFYAKAESEGEVIDTLSCHIYWLRSQMDVKDSYDVLFDSFQHLISVSI